MNKDYFNKELFNFIDNATCSFTCVNVIKEIFEKNGFIRLYENENWNIENSKYYVIRNDASIIAFNIGKEHGDNFNIVCVHDDTSGFCLKPKTSIYEYNYLKINVVPYGGILNYGFMDRPLSISGRVIYKENGIYKKKIIDLREPICVIPSEAIHQNENANTNLDLNTQIDLIPIISLEQDDDVIEVLLNKYINNLGDICDYDLFLYNSDSPKYIGINKEMILSPRIDDLTCTFAALNSFIESDNYNNINVLCVFNSEEIGSLTKDGADSSFLSDVLKRVCSSLSLDISIALSKSIIICADNSHAVHPNHPSKSDVNNQGFLNQGVLICREKETMTDGITSSLFKGICDLAEIPYQDYTSRNDMSTGSTLSGLCVRHVSAKTIDVGLSQLAMHSACEVVGSDDTYYLYIVLKKFYNILFKYVNDDIEMVECDI